MNITKYSGIMISLILLSCCNFTGTNGKLTIYNHAQNGVSSIKIGDTFLFAYVTPGTICEMVFYVPINGKLMADGAATGIISRFYDAEGKITGETVISRADGIFNLKPGFWYQAVIDDIQNGNMYIYISDGYNLNGEKDIDLYQE